MFEQLMAGFTMFGAAAGALSLDFQLEGDEEEPGDLYPVITMSLRPGVVNDDQPRPE